MKKIRLSLEYKCFPIWLLNENGDIIDNNSPEELKSNDILYNKLVSMQEKYNSLFLDDGIEFKYIGFSNVQDEEAFMAEVEIIYSEMKEKLQHKYHFEIMR